jgi:cilia- and flagella-associated protein 44
MILSEAPVEKVMGIDEFYPKDHKEKEIPDSSISRRNVQFFGCYGISSYKRFNLHYLDDNVIIYATGNTYQIYNTETQEKKVFVSQDTDGVGSISVHPSKKYFAIAEKGRMPNIYIYEYPSLKLYRVLRNGTENLYSHVEFSSSGHKLASVGGNPDFTITVWEWINEKVILKAKAFSQEVYKVTFSPFTDDILFTCGSGHIRFWKMAQTFTGLKLQGEIGKFGQLELSDVTGIGELPDGKVLCGTEYGTLILWDGNLVKAHLVLDQ